MVDPFLVKISFNLSNGILLFTKKKPTSVYTTIIRFSVHIAIIPTPSVFESVS